MASAAPAFVADVSACILVNLAREEMGGGSAIEDAEPTELFEALEEAVVGPPDCRSDPIERGMPEEPTIIATPLSDEAICAAAPAIPCGAPPWAKLVFGTPSPDIRGGPAPLVADWAEKTLYDCGMQGGDHRCNNACYIYWVVVHRKRSSARMS